MGQLISPMFTSDFDRIVDGFFRHSQPFAAGLNPSVEVTEEDNFFLLGLDLPGVKKEDVSIDIKDNILTISGERKSGQRQGHFKRSISLPQKINAEKIEAHFEDGVLNVVLPKVEEAKPRPIEIQSGRTGLFGRLLNKASSDA